MSIRPLLTLTVALAWTSAMAQTAMPPGGPEAPQPTIEQRFQHLDANKDGFIEWTEAEPARTPEFTSLDRNKDGVVTPEEWNDRALPFREFDADGNGVMTQAEYLQKHRSMFLKFDADGDGRISPAEFATAQRAVRDQ